MANSTSANLKLTVQATGENSGTWGQITNTNLLILEQAIGGFTTFNLTNANRSLTFSNGALSNGKNDVIRLTGTLAANRTVTIPDSIEKTYFVQNNCDHAGNTLTFKTSSGTGVLLCEGNCYTLYSDGTNINRIDLSTLGGLIATASLSDNSVTTAKISDNQITTAKISDNQIVTAKISDGVISTVKITNNAITADKLERKFTITTNVTPAGGSDGDLWFVYA